MLKRLAIVTVSTLVAISVSGQPNKAAEAKQQQAQQTQPLPSVERRTASHEGEAQSNAPKWYAPLRRPEWWLVVAAFLTLYSVWRQVRESAKATQAMRDSIRLQESGMIQWLELEKWRSKTVRQVDYPENVFLRIEVDIVNKSQFPLTLQDGFIKFVGPNGKGPSWCKFSPSTGTFLAPSVPYTVMADVRIRNEWIAEWQDDGLTFEVSGKLTHIGILKRSVPQEFEGLLLCAENQALFDYRVHPNPQEQDSDYSQQHPS